MAQTVRASLVQQGFPVDFRQLGETVLVGRNTEAPESQTEIARTQAYMLQNVLPTQRGWVSAHYTRVVQPHTYPYYLDAIHTLRDTTGNIALFSLAGGRCMIYSANTGAWVSHALSPLTPVGFATVATFRGESYVCIGGRGLYKYDFLTDTFNLQTLAGIADFSDIIGVVAAGNHLLLYSDVLVYWSDPADPLDFVPALGGAGSSGLAANRSSIQVALPASDGFIVYTTTNAIFGAATSNPNAPFVFREIPGSSGVVEPEHASYDSTSNVQYAWTYSGFQRVSSRGAEPAWPELSDAIAAGLFSYLGIAQYPVTLENESLSVKVSCIGARYTVVSVKRPIATEYRTAYVWDASLERWGKLDIPHIDFFEYRAPEFVRQLTIDELSTAPYDSLTASYNELVVAVSGKLSQFGSMFACVNALGAVHIVLPGTLKGLDTLESENSGAEVPTLLLGKYRFVRESAVQLVSLQCTETNPNIELSVLCHDDAGQFLRAVAPVQSLRARGKYLCRATGSSVSLRVRGRFDLTALSFEMTGAGTAYHPVQATDNTVLPDYLTVQGIPVTVGGEYVLSP